MKILQEWPVNIKEIRQYFDLDGVEAVFTYGDTLYNPSGQDIHPSILHHEEVHSRQQTDPKEWWHKFLTDPQFRLEQELVAYREQWKYIKENYRGKEVKWYLFKMASSLSGKMYGEMVSYQQAEQMIRQ